MKVTAGASVMLMKMEAITLPIIAGSVEHNSSEIITAYRCITFNPIVNVLL